MTPKEAHKVKMGIKASRRAYIYEKQRHDPSYVSANLSVNHPDHGMSWAEHLVEKEARQKSS